MNPFLAIFCCLACSVGTCIASMLISVFTADLFKGKNYSDVGVPMYSESNRAFFIGLIIYLVLISIGFFAWQKLTDLRKYFGAVYVVVNVLFFAVFYHFLMWVTD